MADEVFWGKKDPGGSETAYLLLRVLEGAGIESQVSQASLCALDTPPPRGELERLLTTLKGRADRPQIGMGSAKMHPPQPLARLSKGRASCLDGAYRDRTALINRTRPWEGVSRSRSHGDIPSTGPPPGSDVAASHNDGL